jgi:hypothetical protein
MKTCSMSLMSMVHVGLSGFVCWVLCVKIMNGMSVWKWRSVVCVNLIGKKRRHWEECNQKFSRVQER